MLPKLIVIAGTNASGKSGLGVELALRYGGEIVSADSRQALPYLILYFLYSPPYIFPEAARVLNYSRFSAARLPCSFPEFSHSTTTRR